MEMNGRYYVKDQTVWKAPVARKCEDGQRITLGFKVCIVSDAVDPEDIARALNIAEYGE